MRCQTHLAGSAQKRRGTVPTHEARRQADLAVILDLRRQSRGDHLDHDLVWTNDRTGEGDLPATSNATPAGNVRLGLETSPNHQHAPGWRERWAAGWRAGGHATGWRVSGERPDGAPAGVRSTRASRQGESGWGGATVARTAPERSEPSPPLSPTTSKGMICVTSRPGLISPSQTNQAPCPAPALFGHSFCAPRGHGAVPAPRRIALSRPRPRRDLDDVVTREIAGGSAVEVTHAAALQTPAGTARPAGQRS